MGNLKWPDASRLEGASRRRDADRELDDITPSGHQDPETGSASRGGRIRAGPASRHFGVETAILSVHEHNERARIERIVSQLARGSRSRSSPMQAPWNFDPGAALVAAIREAGFRVEFIPGASAVAAAISASGVSSQGFTFSPIRLKTVNCGLISYRKQPNTGWSSSSKHLTRSGRRLKILANWLNDQL
jgi:hypothetical protein